jgi:hypothetical protein
MGPITGGRTVRENNALPNTSSALLLALFVCLVTPLLACLSHKLGTWPVQGGWVSPLHVTPQPDDIRRLTATAPDADTYVGR